MITPQKPVEITDVTNRVYGPTNNILPQDVLFGLWKVKDSKFETRKLVSLSSIHNGPIAIRNSISGEFKYRPETAYYIADFKLTNDSKIKFELPGFVHVDGARYSPLIKFLKNVLALLVRESGF